MKIYGLSDIGKKRRQNQDSFLIDMDEAGRRAALVVCDGVGGANAGATASELATAAFMSHVLSRADLDGDELRLEQALSDAARYANVKVYDRSYSDPDCAGMGTTLVGALYLGGRLCVVNVGDSRGYRIDGSGVTQITRDHSFVQQLVDLGQLSPSQARTHPKKNIITKALGGAREIEPDVFLPDAGPGDTILLCSDGLSNLVSEEEMLSAYRRYSDFQLWCSYLVKLSLMRGAPDNVTLAALCC